MKTPSSILKCGVIVAAGLGLGLVTGSDLGAMDMQLDYNLFPRATSSNLQTFSQALGGASADPITSSGDSSHPFAVGDSTFSSFADASSRSCSLQHTACAAIANGPNGGGGGGSKTPAGAVTVNECDTQQTACLAAGKSATATAFSFLKTEDANNFYFCDS